MNQVLLRLLNRKDRVKITPERVILNLYQGSVLFTGTTNKVAAISYLSPAELLHGLRRLRPENLVDIAAKVLNLVARDRLGSLREQG